MQIKLERLNVRIDEAQKRQLAKEAARHDITISQLVRAIVKQHYHFKEVP